MKGNFSLLVFTLIYLSLTAQPARYANIWQAPPRHIPNEVSIDAPLMGNGNLTMSLGFKENTLRYYLTKNDFWRLVSKSDHFSGPRVVGYLDITLKGVSSPAFSAVQQLSNGLTTCDLHKSGQSVKVKSWVAATDNLIFWELSAGGGPVALSIALTAPENKRAQLKTGVTSDVYWLTRSFRDSVDIATEAAVALKRVDRKGPLTDITLRPGKKLLIAMAMVSNFKNASPLDEVITKIKKADKDLMEKDWHDHNQWWDAYWHKSSISIGDTVLMKAYYQGLYTMGACSRDRRFAPAIFGWVSTDDPAWNGDYHLNYNYQAPFYGLYSANRLQQGEPHDAPLIDFMPRGQWYAKHITYTRGILLPVGIGPLGIETTRNFPSTSTANKEKGGLFYGQKSNAAYGLINMAQMWRTTYDKNYGRKIYPYALAVVNFWEDYLKLENGRYVIYGDAIHEGSGNDKNPVLSLGLIRNAFDLILDLSTSLKRDRDRRAKWRDILNRISDFPVQTRNGKEVFRYTEEGTAWWDGNGLGIQQIYPANAITLDSPERLLTISRNTIDEMRRWEDMNTSNSFFVAAIRVGYNPDTVLNELHKYALHTYPNGFQLNNPHGIENSCTVENALNEMLCMSAGNVIRLFQGFPRTKDASFKNIRSWGAFLVSADLRNSIVSNVSILSERGRPCTIVNPWPGMAVQLFRNGRRAEKIKGDRLSFKTGVGEKLVLKSVN